MKKIEEIYLTIKDFTRDLSHFIKDQWFYFIHVRPSITKSIIKTYKKNKKFFKTKYNISPFYWDKYMPLNALDENNNPNHKDRLIVNHYRLWTYLGDIMLYQLSGYTVSELKSHYFSKFNLRTFSGNKIPERECYLCELFHTNITCAEADRIYKEIEVFATDVYNSHVPILIDNITSADDVLPIAQQACYPENCHGNKRYDCYCEF